MSVWLAPRGGVAPFAFDVVDNQGGVWQHFDAGDPLRTPWYKRLDLRVEKAFKISAGEFGVYADFTNVFNWSG